MAGDYRHKITLDKLVNDIRIIGIDKKDLITIIREPQYLNKSGTHEKMCDLLLLYRNKIWQPVEVKSSYSSKANKQIRSAYNYINEVFNMQYTEGLIVTYKEGIKYRKVRFR